MDKTRISGKKGRASENESSEGSNDEVPYREGQTRGLYINEVRRRKGEGDSKTRKSRKERCAT